MKMDEGEVVNSGSPGRTRSGVENGVAEGRECGRGASEEN